MRNLLSAGLVAGFAAVLWRIISGLSGIQVSQPTPEGTYTDTYYVVAHVHLIAGFVTALFLPLALHIFLLRNSPRNWVRTASYASLFIGLAGLLLWAYQDQLLSDPGPWRYTDYSDLARRFATLNFIAMALVLTACAASFTLAVLDLIHRRKSKT